MTMHFGSFRAKRLGNQPAKAYIIHETINICLFVSEHLQFVHIQHDTGLEYKHQDI